MLVLQIAAGIVLAWLTIRYWEPIVARSKGIGRVLFPVLYYGAIIGVVGFIDQATGNHIVPVVIAVLLIVGWLVQRYRRRHPNLSRP